MANGRLVDRVAPIVAGTTGLGWFWAELAPQREAFPDTDDPAVSLQFLAAHSGAWIQAGLFLGLAAFAILATVLARHRVVASRPGPEGAAPSIWPSFVTVIGVLSAALLLGMAVIRLSVGPLLYIRSLDQGWGEVAYLVTQLVGVHLFAIGGVLLLSIWIVGVAWLGFRRGEIPRALALLAIVPAIRLAAPILGWLGVTIDGLWPVYMAAIPAGWIWLILLGVTGLWTTAHAPSQRRLESAPDLA